MKNKKKYSIGFLISAVALWCATAGVSCTHKSSPEPTVSFSKDIIPIFNTSCALNSTCHQGANGGNDEIALDSAQAYSTIISKNLASVKSPSASLLYVELATGVMPKPPAEALPASQQYLILLWIEQGAKNN